MYMLAAKHGFAQSVDLCFVLAIHELTHDYSIPGLRTHDEREGTYMCIFMTINMHKHVHVDVPMHVCVTFSRLLSFLTNVTATFFNLKMHMLSLYIRILCVYLLTVDTQV